MNIKEFKSLHKSNIQDSKQIFDRWDKEKSIDELLNTPVAPGIVLFDVLHGDQALDQIKPELRDAFQALMKDKADTYEEIRREIYEKIELGDKSVQGTINKILGQVGENQFIEDAEKLGLNARLAESGSQKSWDVAIDHENGISEHVQVKFHSDSNRVIKEIEEVNREILSGDITDGDQIVKSIDFAVPKDIHDEVVQKVNDLNLNTKVYEINMTSEEGRDIVELGFGFSADTRLAIENLFSELFAASLTAVALHGLVNGFLLYKGAKDLKECIGDTLEQSAISTGAISTGIGTEALIAEISTLGGPPLFILVLGTTITTREILKRIANRQSYVDWLRERNAHLNQVIMNYK